MPEPIVETCRDPATTRAKSLSEPVPCFRCLAYRPETETGCHFLEQRPPRAPQTSPIRRGPIKQTKLW